MRVFLCRFSSVMLAAIIAPSVVGQTVGQLDQITAILIRHGAPGGVSAFDGCSPHSIELKAFPGQTTDEELNTLSSNGGLEWRKVDGGYFVRVGNSQGPDLLDVKLPEIKLDTEDPVINAGALLANTFVQKEQARLSLRMLDRSIGFSALPKDTQNDGESAHLILPPGTLLEDLNRIATRSGKAVWLYKESSCGGDRVASLSWIAR
jgi:hypothetical protein